MKTVEKKSKTDTGIKILSKISLNLYATKNGNRYSLYLNGITIGKYRSEREVLNARECITDVFIRLCGLSFSIKELLNRPRVISTETPYTEENIIMIWENIFDIYLEKLAENAASGKIMGKDEVISLAVAEYVIRVNSLEDTYRDSLPDGESALSAAEQFIVQYSLYDEYARIKNALLESELTKSTVAESAVAEKNSLT